MTSDGQADAEEAYPDPPVEVATVAPATLKRRLDAGEPVRLLDVRDRDEVQAWAIDAPGVTLTQLPYQRFLQAQVTDAVADLAGEIDGDGPITVVCGYGAASGYVAGLLEEAGIEARNLADGMRGWARVYEARAVSESDPTVLQYQRPASGCLAYLVIDGEEAVVVDPLRAFVDRYAADAAERGADLVAAVDTHLHADHISGLRALAVDPAVTAYLPERTLDRGVAIDATPLAPGDALPVGEISLEAVALPGHTTDMTGLRVADILFAGDSVFLDAVARPDLQETDAGAPALAAELHETLTERLASLPADTVVAPGHVGEETTPGPEGTFTATLGALRERLPAFDAGRDALVEALLGGLPEEPANFERIVAVNAGRETVDDETAFELELGPNNCAATPGE